MFTLGFKFDTPDLTTRLFSCHDFFFNEFLYDKLLHHGIIQRSEPDILF